MAYTIDDLNALVQAASGDELPIWDVSETGPNDEPTKKITLQNLAAAIKTLASLLGTGDVVDNLNNPAPDKPLSSNMGKVLNDKIATSSVSGKQYIRKSGNNVTINLTDITIADLIQYTIPEGLRPYLRVRCVVIVRSLSYTDTSVGWIQIESTGAISLRKVTNNGGTEEITTGYVEGTVSWNI